MMSMYLLWVQVETSFAVFPSLHRCHLAPPVCAIIFEDYVSVSEEKLLGDLGLTSVIRPSTTIGFGGLT